MDDNHFKISGIVCSIPRFKESPAGIAHWHFWIEHHSRRQEADRERSVYCRVAVVAVGKQWRPSLATLKRGQKVQAEGFMNNRKLDSDANRLVLNLYAINTDF